MNGTITTIAGADYDAPLGDGGPAIGASLTPVSIALDSSSNLLIADINGRVRKVTNGVISTIVGNGGFAGRYGGEEFCLLVPNADTGRALEIGEMVRADVTALALPHATSNHECVTVSIGVACATPNAQLAVADLIEAADAALYTAKHRGRNTVVAHGIIEVVASESRMAGAS